MKVGILKADNVNPVLTKDFGEYPDMFDRFLKMTAPEISIQTYDVCQGEYPQNIHEVDAYLLTGSRAGVYDDLPWFPALADFVKSLHSNRKKLVGICFGHQFIAHTLGGRAEKSSKGWGLGCCTTQVRSESDKQLYGVSEFNLIFCHQDQVVVPAEGAKVIAGNNFCPYAMCVMGGHIMTFQAHPEFTKEFTSGFIHNEKDTYGSDLSEKAIESLGDRVDQKLVSQWITDFLKA